MSKVSARLVILSAIINGDTVENIVPIVKEKCEVTKEDAAIKKDINWYRAYAKKEELIDADGFATEKGETWVANGGKKPVDPKVQAEREAKKKAKEEKAAAAKAEREKKAAEKKAANASKKESSAAKTPASTTNDAGKKKETGKPNVTPGKKPGKKPAAVAAAEQKAATQDDEL